MQMEHEAGYDPAKPRLFVSNGAWRCGIVDYGGWVTADGKTCADAYRALGRALILRRIEQQIRRFREEYECLNP